MARKSDMEKLSYDELIALKRRVEKALEAKKSEHVDQVRAQIHAQLEKAGLSVADVLGHAAPSFASQASLKPRGPAKGSKVAPKFRNPKNPEQTWSGRGLKPRWLQEALGRGQKLESFKIKGA
ncbi:MAG: H-NS histone family protein [Hyphomicrobium sp.]|nr:H-NS histone family protein [Hyphomicrobium sp.]